MIRFELIGEELEKAGVPTRQSGTLRGYCSAEQFQAALDALQHGLSDTLPNPFTHNLDKE